MLVLQICDKKGTFTNYLYNFPSNHPKTYHMENFTTVFAIINVATGILYIILFFKVWCMTNDVRQIKEKTCNGIESQKLSAKTVITLKMLGKEKEAHDLILSRMDDKIKGLSSQLVITSPSVVQQSWEDAVKGYKILFNYIGETIPVEYETFSFTKLADEADKLRKA